MKNGKASMVLICCLLIGCAYGIKDPAIQDEASLSNNKNKQEQETSDLEKIISCYIIRTVWQGNCKLDLIYCDDGQYRLSGKCYPPDWAPPWKNLPDPPY